MNQSLLHIHPEIQQALAEGKPVVALESTIIAHGMPFPQNLETAAKLEQTIRKQDALPATIAILAGNIKVGLAREDLSELAQNRNVLKVSRRDLAYVVANQLYGATTVSATMYIAALAGIRVFVTGGIGGVHRGAQETFDISADLTELTNTPVAVVCAGAKSLLDIPLTLEYLETQGVPLLTYQADEFPAFYTRHSGCPGGYRVENPQQIAEIARVHWWLGFRTGLVVANPIPEVYAMDYEEVEAATQEALKLAHDQKIKGKALTPFLLSYIKSLTGGKSLEANIKLVLNNAELGAKIAAAYAKG